MARNQAPDAEAPEEQVPVSRREFINIAWLASLGFFLVPVGGATILFAYPRFKEGEFGGKFTLRLSDMPETGSSPPANTKGKFWLARTEDGFRAIYKVCTHLGCLYNWQAQENKFICPCHGSQFELDSTYITGPAPRALDLFRTTALAPDGTALATTEGPNEPIPVFDDPDVVYVVDTGDRVIGQQHE